MDSPAGPIRRRHRFRWRFLLAPTRRRAILELAVPASPSIPRCSIGLMGVPSVMPPAQHPIRVGPSTVIQGSFPDNRPRIIPAMPTAGGSPRNGARGSVQPQAGDAVALPIGFLLAPRGSGQPLPELIQRKMEGLFNASFADVRVHIGHQASSIGALAFTHGSDLYFAPGQYNPMTARGQQLLGHELAHVVQQRAGRVKNPLPGGVALIVDGALEAEADRLGMRAAAHAATARAQPISPARPAAAPAIQPTPRTAITPAAPPGTIGPAVQRSAPVNVSGMMPVGDGRYRIAVGMGGQQVGSVMVHRHGESAIEVTDLAVDPSYRRQGLGGVLMTSALRAGLQLGRTRVILASQDNGTGRLTAWYRNMGFAPVGCTKQGHPVLEAPIGRALSGALQCRLRHSPASTTQTMAAGAGSPRFAPTAISRDAARHGQVPGPGLRPTLAPRAGTPVVQRMRAHLPYQLDFVVVPQINMQEYKNHASMRTTHFFTVVLCAVKELQRQLGAVTSGLFTDHAKAQIAKGFRLGSDPEDKQDAAHLMNTTLVPSSFPVQNAKVQLLYEASAATTNQFQKANVGPDKIIDAAQTASKNAMLHAIHHGAIVDHNFVVQHVRAYLNAILHNLPALQPAAVELLDLARNAAREAIQGDLDNIDARVQRIETEIEHF